ncbi:hypothetical protein CSOJ01_15869 [Colletotrichum sojae]|uniref:Uncharacterized protein n=1 Tax=Colletotrichum sojae TaxID=2175907 RepID=A0A8H6MI71_9PEZI|nr:hypothetical protein CSOJ01_15869 [Colletotrichum sojae]
MVMTNLSTTCNFSLYGFLKVRFSSSTSGTQTVGNLLGHLGRLGTAGGHRHPSLTAAAVVLSARNKQPTTCSAHGRPVPHSAGGIAQSGSRILTRLVRGGRRGDIPAATATSPPGLASPPHRRR